MSYRDSNRSAPAGSPTWPISRPTIRILSVQGPDPAHASTSSPRQKVSIHTRETDDLALEDHELCTPVDGASSLCDQPTGPRRPVRVRADHRHFDDPSSSGSAHTLTNTITTLNGERNSAADTGGSWTAESAVENDAHLSLSAAPVRPSVPLRLATWSGGHTTSPKGYMSGVPSAFLRQLSEQQKQQYAHGSFGGRQFSETPPSLPTSLANAADDQSAVATRYFSPFANIELDSHHNSGGTDSDAERPSSQRAAFARRINQLADARVSVYSGVDAPFLSELEQHAHHSEGSADDAHGKDRGTRRSDGTSSMNVMVLGSTVPSDLPPEPVSKTRDAVLMGSPADTSVDPIHLSESAARMTTSFMSLSTMADHGQSASSVRSPRLVTEKRTTIMFSPSGPLVEGTDLGSGPAPMLPSRPSVKPGDSLPPTAPQSKVPSTSSGDGTVDLTGPPNADRRGTLPLSPQAFFCEVPASPGKKPAVELLDTASPLRVLCQQMEHSFDELTKEEARGYERLLATEVSDFLRLARQIRESQRAANTASQRTIKSLEDEEVHLLRRECAARMARQDVRSDTDIAAIVAELPCKVVATSGLNAVVEPRDVSQSVSMPDKLRARIDLVGAQSRVEAEIARQLRVQKELDAQHGPVRYFPVV